MTSYVNPDNANEKVSLYSSNRGTGYIAHDGTGNVVAGETNIDDDACDDDVEDRAPGQH